MNVIEKLQLANFIMLQCIRKLVSLHDLSLHVLSACPSRMCLPELLYKPMLFEAALEVLDVFLSDMR